MAGFARFKILKCETDAHMWNKSLMAWETLVGLPRQSAHEMPRSARHDKEHSERNPCHSEPQARNLYRLEAFFEHPLPSEGVRKIGGIGYPKPCETPSHQTLLHPTSHPHHAACPHHPLLDATLLPTPSTPPKTRTPTHLPRSAHPHPRPPASARPRLVSPTPLPLRHSPTTPCPL